MNQSNIKQRVRMTALLVKRNTHQFTTLVVIALGLLITPTALAQSSESTYKATFKIFWLKPNLTAIEQNRGGAIKPQEKEVPEVQFHFLSGLKLTTFQVKPYRMSAEFKYSGKLPQIDFYHTIPKKDANGNLPSPDMRVQLPKQQGRYVVIAKQTRKGFSAVPVDMEVLNSKKTMAIMYNTCATPIRIAVVGQENKIIKPGSSVSFPLTKIKNNQLPFRIHTLNEENTWQTSVSTRRAVQTRQSTVMIISAPTQNSKSLKIDVLPPVFWRKAN